MASRFDVNEILKHLCHNRPFPLTRTTFTASDVFSVVAGYKCCIRIVYAALKLSGC